MSSPPPNIVIVGAGFAGLNTFNFLHAKLSKLPASSPTQRPTLTLITPRPFFTHLPGLLRTAVTSAGHLEDHVLMPLTPPRFTSDPHVKLLIASVVSVVDDAEAGQRHVLLDNGDKVDFAVLVLAPGSTWEGPLDLPLTSKREEVVRVFEEWREKFAKARDIVLVGGGSIGAELAGEIKDLDPTKNVTIIHSKPLLFNEAYPQKWRSRAAQRWASRGVNLILDDYVDDLEIKEDGRVHTRGGKKVKADLVVPTRGPLPNTAFLASLSAASSSTNPVLTKQGLIPVTPTLQLPSHPRIFAAGDVIQWAEQKQAAKARNHAGVVAHNVLVLLGLDGGKGEMKEYKTGPEMILVTNGKNGGTGYVDLLWGITLGDFFSRLLKSKGLIISMIKGSLQL